MNIAHARRVLAYCDAQIRSKTMQQISQNRMREKLLRILPRPYLEAISEIDGAQRLTRKNLELAILTLWNETTDTEVIEFITRSLSA